MSITIDTVGACLTYGYTIRGYCRCGRQKELDLRAISVAHGENLTLDDLFRRLRCACGGKPSAQITPNWNPYPGSK